MAKRGLQILEAIPGSKPSLLWNAFMLVLAIGPGRAVADFTFGPAVNLGPVVNGASSNADPYVSADGLSLYFDSNRGGISELWVTTRASIWDPWGPPVNLGPTVNSSSLRNFAPCVSSDGLELYFTRVAPGTDACRGTLWVTRRATPSDPWGPPVNLTSFVPPEDAQGACYPRISADGLSLFFGHGFWTQQWVTTRPTEDSPWGPAVKLENLASLGQSYWSSVSADGLALFFGTDSGSPAGTYNWNIWLTMRHNAAEAWGTAYKLGPNVNDGDTFFSCAAISADGSTLYFHSARPGSLGSYDLWQVPVIPDCDFNGDGKVDEEDLLVMKEHWGQDDSQCDVGPMPWGDGIVDLKDLRVFMENTGKPARQTSDVPADAVLSWVSPWFSQTHDVYLGTSFEDVNRADRDHPLGVLASKGQTATTYDPPGRLEYGRTYHWRIDEANTPDGPGVYKGDTWSFTVEAASRPVTPVKATASSSLNSLTGAEKTIDGSGLDALDQHSTTASDMWISKKEQSHPWIRYDFDRPYLLYQMWVWNSNQDVEPDVGFGAEDVTIETSLDGTTWTTLDGVPEFAQATGEPNYVHSTTVEFGGLQAQYVKLTISSNWAGTNKQCGLSEVRFFYIPAWAREPQPASGAVDLPLDTVLSWRAGREAATHQIYLSTDQKAVVNRTAPALTVTAPRLNPGPLEIGTTYYWRVDEVNEARTLSMWEGDVWSFSTKDYLVVDDFEQYDDACARIFYTWLDGQGYSDSEDCGIMGFGGNHTDSAVGNIAAPFAEQTVVHGGKQSMPLAYDNSIGIGISEAVRTFGTPQDWTVGGATALVLFLHGDRDNGIGQVYAKINGVEVTYDGTTNPTTASMWKQWTIDLASMPGLDPKAVSTLAIGVSGTSRGVLYVDDIRLYRSAPAVPVPADPGTVGLAAYYPFDGNAGDASGHGLNGTITGSPLFPDSLPSLGQAIQLNGTNDYVDLPIGDLISTLSSATFATWVDYNQGGSWMRIFDFGSGTSMYMFLTPAVGFGGNMRFAITTGSANGESRVKAPRMQPSGWHHIAVVMNGGSMTAALYLDGTVVGSNSIKLLPKDLGKTTQNWLGRSQWAADSYLSGKLDDFRIYNRALSEAEVRYLAGDR